LADVTTIEIDTPGGPIDALLSVPDGQGPWPGVVVVHDAIGYGPDNESTSARIAAAGFVAVTPNLFSRGGRARCITRVFRDLLTQRGRALDDILAARDHVQSMPECTGSVGVVGFCMGGQFALVMAPKGFGASAPFYGTPLPRNLSETLDGACPIVASFGRRDPMGRGAPARLRKAVDDKSIAADIKVYPDAGHSFANKLPAQPLLRITGFGYNDAATEDAYRRVFAFFQPAPCGVGLGRGDLYRAVYLVDAPANQRVGNEPPHMPPVTPDHGVVHPPGLGPRQIVRHGFHRLTFGFAEGIRTLDGDARSVVNPLRPPRTVIGDDQQLAPVGHAPDRGRLRPAVFGERGQQQVLAIG
jgi:carboxymethylenebutenolidase